MSAYKSPLKGCCDVGVYSSVTEFWGLLVSISCFWFVIRLFLFSVVYFLYFVFFWMLLLLFRWSFEIILMLFGTVFCLFQSKYEISTTRKTKKT